MILSTPVRKHKLEQEDGSYPEDTLGIQPHPDLGRLLRLPLWSFSLFPPTCPSTAKIQGSATPRDKDLSTFS